MAIAAYSPPTLLNLSFHRSDYGCLHSSTTTNLLNPKLKRSSIRCQSTSTEDPKTKRNLLDNASNLLTNLLSGGNLGSMPIAEGAVTDLFDRPLFFSLYDWFIEHGSVYKLAFGPKAFVVVADPIVARHILRENAFATYIFVLSNYFWIQTLASGVLADILEPIMGKGLIPADLETWKQRRRVIAPGFHAVYLEAMVKMFCDCSERTVSKFEKLLVREEVNGGKTIEVDLEAEFLSLGLDIIGLGVFNYDFGSVTKESPVIKAVYGTLSEAEHRSTFYIPYWKFPLARWIVPRQRKFYGDLKVINDCLDELIRNAKETRQETDVKKLQQRDYANLKDASLLHFLVDMRGSDVDDRQLRDDLMTMLIAGHETTAAVLTWAIFFLAQNPSKMKKAQTEIDSGSFAHLLVARSNTHDFFISGGYKGEKDGYKIPAGTDIFVSVYNLHRSPYYWDHPNVFEPERFSVQKNSEIEGWAGFDPSRSPGAYYPNEIMADFSFLPFGGGPRKCVGDQFALLESTVSLAMPLVTGATIHTKNGMWCKLSKRSDVQ
ncbi:hypothetical protein ACLB2K_062417 [Fragaria x ananassa]